MNKGAEGRRGISRERKILCRSLSKFSVLNIGFFGAFKKMVMAL
jgi:hypothetical protein